MAPRAHWGKAEAMSDSVIYVVTVSLLVALSFLALWIARQSLGFEGVKLFQSKPRRLGLIESTAIDGRRRLLLIRRDNVEHLIMTGGPVDVVVETGIPLRHLAVNGLGDMIGRADQTRLSSQAFAAEDAALALQRETAS
jgi:hypothetical protein